MSFKPRLIKTTFAFAVAAIFPVSAMAADILGPAEPLVIEAPQADRASGGGIYIAARVGAGANDPIKFDLDNLASVPTEVVSKYGHALTGSTAIGYGFNMDRFGARVEAEGGISSAAITNHTVVDQLLIGAPTSFDKPAAYGDATITYGLINAAADMKLGVFSPYLTAGLGLASVDFDNHGIVLTSTMLGMGPGFVTALNTTQEGLAWQIGTGIGYQLSEKVMLDFGYRHFRVEDVSLVTVDATTTKEDIVQNTATLGMRVYF